MFELYSISKDFGWNLISAIQTMPLIPGKVVLGILSLLSLAVWAQVVSKTMQLFLKRGADQRFAQRLLNSSSCLEVFEEGSDFSPSPKFEIYQSGAREAALEMIGSEDPIFLTENHLATPGSLEEAQLAQIDRALERSEQFTTHRLKRGLERLRFISFSAPVLGTVAALWMMVAALYAERNTFQILLDQTLILVVSSLFVSAPAGIVRVLLLNHCRAEAEKIRGFRLQLAGVFRNYLKSPKKSLPTPPPNQVTKKSSRHYYSLTHPHPPTAPNE